MHEGQSKNQIIFVIKYKLEEKMKKELIGMKDEEIIIDNHNREE